MADGRTTWVRLLRAVPERVAVAAGLAAGQRAVGTKVRVRHDDAVELVVEGWARFDHEAGDGTLGKPRVDAAALAAAVAAVEARVKGDVAEVTPESVAGALPARLSEAALRAAFVVRAPAPTGVAATDTAALTAAAQAAAAAGGGTVLLRPGVHRLNAPLPVLPGVVWQGSPPVVANPVNTSGIWMADAEMTFTAGTVLKGDGTTSCFEANAVDQAAVPAQIGTTQISNAGIRNLAIDGFTYGVRVGAVNIMGLTWGTVEKLYISNCSVWGVFLANFQHVDIRDVRTSLCQNGQYYGALLPGATFMPGNSAIGELHNVVPRDGRDNRKCRGIVLEAGGTAAALNELILTRLQCNGFNRGLLSVTATLTNGSTAVAVPDGSQFLPGMVLTFATTGGGFTAGQAYVVQTVTGNTLTLGTSRTTAAIAATAAATPTVRTYGFPNVEVTSRNSGARVQNSRILQLDSEGETSVGTYLENANAVIVEFADIPATALVHIVARNSSFSQFHSRQAASVDFDGPTVATSHYAGTRSGSYGVPIPGLWRDQVYGATVLQLAGGNFSAPFGDLQPRANYFLYPGGSGLGEKITARNATGTLNGTQCGNIVITGNTATTLTMPTIVGDTTAVNSHIGLWYEFSNIGSATCTVATDGTQVFNNITGRTSLAVPAGTGLKVVAVKDAAGTLTWLAKPFTLAS
jgi:hypothetical protein